MKKQKFLNSLLSALMAMSVISSAATPVIADDGTEEPETEEYLEVDIPEEEEEDESVEVEIPDEEDEPVEIEIPDEDEEEEEIGTGSGALTYMGSVEDLDVTAAASENVFPEGTEMTVETVTDTEVLDLIKATVGENAEVLAAVDITFTNAEGEVVQPDGGDVRVAFENAGITYSDNLKLVHVDNRSEEMTAEILDQELIETEEGGIAFDADQFSIYAVVETGQDARISVIFKKPVKNSDGTITIETIQEFTNRNETSDGTNLVESIYDPGVDVLGEGQKFLGWVKGTPTGVAGEEYLTIKEIRNQIGVLLTSGVADGTEVTYYAAIFNVYNVTYLDEEGVTVDSDYLLIPVVDYSSGTLTGTTSADYTVNKTYSAYYQNYGFNGWGLLDADGNVTATYANGNTIANVSSDIVLKAQVKGGHYLIFDENGKGASYTAPQFVYSGEKPTEPADPTRTGYTFGGWYTDEDCTDDNEFDFDAVLGKKTTVYAKWTANATAKYTVIIWKQDLTDESKYYFADTYVGEGTVGSYISYNVIDNGAQDYISFESGSSSTEETYVQVATTDDDGRVESWTDGYSYSSSETYYYSDTDDSKIAYYYKKSNSSSYRFYSDSNHSSKLKNQTIYIKTSSGSAVTTDDAYNYTGFCVKDPVTENTTVTTETVITAEGDAVINVYYTRLTYTLKFYYYRTYGSTTQVATTGSGSGDLGASWSGDSAPTCSYTDNKGSETIGNYTYYYYSITAKYGADIGSSWPEYDKFSDTSTNKRHLISWILMDGAKAKTSTTGGGSTVKGKITVMDEQVLGDTTSLTGNYLVARYNDESNNWNYKIWLETLDGVDYTNETTTTVNGVEYYLKETLVLKSSGTTASQQHAPAYSGFENIDEDQESGTSPYVMNYYYERLSYKVHYMDGTYVNGDTTSQGNEPLKDSAEYKYEASIADEAYTPEKTGYIFAGWYEDKSCTKAYSFTGKTMPKGGVIVYAKWVLIQYRVFLHPNADESFENYSITSATSFRVDYGSKIGTITCEADDYHFVGWYTDADFTKSWDFDAYVANDDNIKTTYNKTEPTELDEYGNAEDTSNSDAVNNRTWITRKLDLYAKWRAELEGAAGINVEYYSNDAWFATDALVYADNATAIANAASTTTDTTKYFAYWVVQKWDATTNAYVDTEVYVNPGDTFTVKASDAFKEAVSGGYTYTVRLRAEFENKTLARTTKVTYNANGGKITGSVNTGGSSSVTVSGEATYTFDITINQDFTLIGNDVVKLYTTDENGETVVDNTWEFAGWAFTADATEPAVVNATTLVKDAKVAADNLDRSATVPNDTAANTLYAVWIRSVTIRHSSAIGSTDANYPEYETVKVSRNSTIDLTAHVYTNKDSDNGGYLYGGYYKNDTAKTVAYTGQDDYWDEDDAYKASGKTLSPEYNVTYFLKELPGYYLTPRLQYFYSVNTKNLTRLYVCSAIDDGNYSDFGFATLTAAAAQAEGITYDTAVLPASYVGTNSKDVKVVRSVWFRAANEENCTAGDIIKESYDVSLPMNDETTYATNGVIYYAVPSLKAANTNFNYVGYVITLDGVTVCGKKLRRVGTGSGQYTGDTTGLHLLKSDATYDISNISIWIKSSTETE